MNRSRKLLAAASIAITATTPAALGVRAISAQDKYTVKAPNALGVADQLKDGPKSCDSLARACGAHPASLYRLLRALAAVGVFHETAIKEFSLTRLGVCLTGDATGSARYSMTGTTTDRSTSCAPAAEPCRPRRLCSSSNESSVRQTKFQRASFLA